ncbi:MAG: DUF3459 domain-containing protein, partial [Actinomycetota bacterium]|nr:DUF3459 domain-containing protein [Actinomycetota bacterium]
LDDPRVVEVRDRNGLGCDAQWSDDFHHALHSALTGERAGYYADFGSVADVVQALRDVFVNAGKYSRLRQRRHGRPVGDVPRTRFLGYMQDHDQVGNRARGERSAALMSTGRLQVAAALVLLGPFVPMLFAGEEWAASTPFQYFTDHQDQELGRRVSEGRRREFASFGWTAENVPDPQDPATFQRSKLDWDERVREPHATMLRWHRELVALRAASASLRDGNRSTTAVDHDEERRWLVMRRPGLTVACHWGEGIVHLPVARATVLLSNVAHEWTSAGLAVPADGVVVVLGS